MSSSFEDLTEIVTSSKVQDGGKGEFLWLVPVPWTSVVGLVEGCREWFENNGIAGDESLVGSYVVVPLFIISMNSLFVGILLVVAANWKTLLSCRRFHKIH